MSVTGSRWLAALPGLLVCATFLAACREPASSPSNPTPAITHASPWALYVGTAHRAVRLIGTDFVDGSTVLVNDQERPGRFVSRTELLVELDASDVAFPATLSLRVRNP